MQHWNTHSITLCLILLISSLSASEGQGHLVDIGNDRKLYLECQGKETPTVVFISGRSDRGSIWKTKPLSVFLEVSKFTHACIYDRPGTVTINQNTVLPTPSTAVSQPSSVKDKVEDLHALLKAANIQEPFVLVAHSYGGLIARLFAHTYPDSVSGLVLIDIPTEFMYDALTPSQQALWIQLNSNYSPDLDAYTIQEKTDFIADFAQMRALSVPRSIPVITFTADQSFDFKKLKAQGILPSNTPLEFESVVFQAHLKGQKHLAQLFNAKQIDHPHSGHYIQTEQPQIVIEAIREVVEKAQKIQACTQNKKEISESRNSFVNRKNNSDNSVRIISDNGFHTGVRPGLSKKI